MRDRKWTAIALTNLDALLADPLVQRTMASDGVTEEDIRLLFEQTKAGIRARPTCVVEGTDGFRPQA